MTGQRYLLDTHILIWSLDQSARLSERYMDLLSREESCVVNIVSFWEIAIKKSLGKLQIRDDVADLVASTGVTILPIDLSHIRTLGHLPHHHRDPFDRMLIAQAMCENLKIMTVDRRFADYDVVVA